MPWWFQWIWNAIPWYGFVIAALVLIAVFWQPIMAIWSILPRPIKAAILFIGSIVVAVQYGRNRGQVSERAKQDAANERIQHAKGKIDAKVNHMSPDAVDDALHKSGRLRD